MAGIKKSPKANKSKKAKKKEEVKRKQVEEEEEENEVEFQKAVLEIRIKELETLNKGLRGKCDYLESQNNVYKTQLEESREERNDLVNYLQKCLTEEKTIAKELEDRLYGMQEARYDDIRDFDQKFKQKDEEFDGIKAKLDKTIFELRAKLEAIEEFRVQKVALTKEREDLKKTLNDERKMFTQKFEELENKTIIYRDKLKKDAVDTLIKMAEDVQKAGKMSLTSAVKASIAANVKLNQELEIVSKDNLKLRDSLEICTSKLRDSRATVEILEKENSMVHKKCLQYKGLLEILLDKQVQMEAQIKLVCKLEMDLRDIQNEHSKCKTEKDIRDLIKTEIEIESSSSKQDKRLDSLLEVEVKRLRDIIIKMAIVAKDLSEASNGAEFEFLKGRFNRMLIRLYESACDIQDLPNELKSRLIIQLPEISSFKRFS